MRHLYLIRVKNRAELEDLFKLLCYIYIYCQDKPCEKCQSKLCNTIVKLLHKIYKQLY